MSATKRQICQLDALDDPLPNIIPAGGISILAGAPNIGKTALLASVLREFRDGRLVFGHQPNPLAGIGIVTADRGWARSAGKWFERAGYGDILRYAMADDKLFDPKSLRRKFDRTARLMEMADKLKLPPGGLLAVDPIGLFLGGNLNDYDSCAVAAHELRAALRDRTLTMLASAHCAKLKADKKDRYMRLTDQILGSTAIAGFTDTTLYLASPEEIDKPYYALVVHPHLAPLETFYLERDEQGLFVPYTGADRGTLTRVLNAFPENGDEITLGVLVEVLEPVPLTRRTIQRTLIELIEQHAVVKVRHGVYRRVIAH